MTKRGSHRGALVPSSSFSSGPVHFRIIHDTGTQTMAEMGVDYSRADVPERAYYADHLDVQKARSGISLLFGKLIPGSNRLRSQVEIVFPDDMFLRQLWGTSRDLHQTLIESRHKWRLEPMEGEVVETDKVQTFRSNNVFMGIWGDEGVLDFYYVSPRDLYYVKTGDKNRVDLEPVVRIVLYPGLLLEFLSKCEPLIPFLEASTPEVVSHENLGHR